MFLLMFSLVRRIVRTASPGLLAGLAALWLVATDREGNPAAVDRDIRTAVPSKSERISPESAHMRLRLDCVSTDLPGGERSVVIVRRSSNVPDL